MFADITYTLGIIGILLLVNNMEYVNMYISGLWENNKNKTLNDLLVEAFWKGSYAYTFVKYRCGKLYSTFPLVRSCVDAIAGSRKSAKQPMEYPWASITQLIKNENDTKLSINEQYFDLSDFEWQYKSISENLLKLNHIAIQLLETSNNIQECLLLVAPSKDGIISRVIDRKNNGLSIENDKLLTQSSVKFLLTDYVHPELSDPIETVINKAYFMEGNQILSRAFVGRILSKNGFSGPFDIDYTISIINQEIKTENLGYTDYIEIIDNKTYVVKSNSCHCSSPESTKYSTNNNEEVSNAESNNSEDEETKSWDKVDKE
uniref:Uncharacterized protein n=1 Tax=viral metagenome TaxID=1070528 RepID=A0A6C0JY26_9ZZZZ